MKPRIRYNPQSEMWELLYISRYGHEGPVRFRHLSVLMDILAMLYALEAVQR